MKLVSNQKWNARTPLHSHLWMRNIEEDAVLAFESGSYNEFVRITQKRIDEMKKRVEVLRDSSRRSGQLNPARAVILDCSHPHAITGSYGRQSGVSPVILRRRDVPLPR